MLRSSTVAVRATVEAISPKQEAGLYFQKAQTFELPPWLQQPLPVTPDRRMGFLYLHFPCPVLEKRLWKQMQVVVEKEELVTELRGKKQKPAMTQKHYTAWERSKKEINLLLSCRTQTSLEPQFFLKIFIFQE